MDIYTLNESSIRSLSKEIVEKYLPEEIALFDTIWQVMREHIFQWDESIPENWQNKEYQKSLKKELGFLDEAEVSEINTPKVIALISLVWLRLAKFKGQIQDANIEGTIAEYGKTLPEWLRVKTIRLAVPMIKEDLKKIGRYPFMEEEEEKKYVMYSHKAKKGESISESELEKKEVVKKEYAIWMNALKGIVFVYDEKIDLGPLYWHILVYLIKKEGGIATYQELFETFCRLAKDTDKYSKWDESLRIYVHRWFSDIHKKTKDKLVDFIINVRNNGYRINTESNELKYCLIETKHIE